MHKGTIIEKLLSLQYSEEQANQVADELAEIASSLRPLLADWLYNSKESDVSVEGFSLIELKNTYRMTYPASLLTIDWLLKDPIAAVEAISQGIQ